MASKSLGVAYGPRWQLLRLLYDSTGMTVDINAASVMHVPMPTTERDEEVRHTHLLLSSSIESVPGASSLAQGIPWPRAALVGLGVDMALFSLAWIDVMWCTEMRCDVSVSGWCWIDMLRLRIIRSEQTDQLGLQLLVGGLFPTATFHFTSSPPPASFGIQPMSSPISDQETVLVTFPDDYWSDRPLSSVQCKFGDQLVLASRIEHVNTSVLVHFRTPIMTHAQDVLMQITLNGEQFLPLQNGASSEQPSPLHTSAQFYSFYAADIIISTILPSNGPLAGGTTAYPLC